MVNYTVSKMDFKSFRDALASGDETFTVNGNLYKRTNRPGVGYMRVLKNLTVDSLEPSQSGDINLNGNLRASNQSVSLTGGSLSVSSTGSLSLSGNSDITMIGGSDISVTDGTIGVTNGSITVTTGAVRVTGGDITSDTFISSPTIDANDLIAISNLSIVDSRNGALSRLGTVTLGIGGTVTIPINGLTEDDRIFVSSRSPNAGVLHGDIDTDGNTITISSSEATDSGDVDYVIIRGYSSI